MLDFTSALYLGMSHARADLADFGALTTGKPARLREPDGAEEAAASLASLLGATRAVLAPSTLHLFWDLFGMLSPRNVHVVFDADMYPVGRWGVERAAARGLRTWSFRHCDPDHLEAVLRWSAAPDSVPFVVADGFCLLCGRPAPLVEYIQRAAARGGVVLLDDTQALGVLGAGPTAESPFGLGGGGSLRYHGVAPDGALVCASLAKAFGAPAAVLSGPSGFVRRFEAVSPTRVHTSPVSAAHVAAVAAAIERNRREGDVLRARLLAAIWQFRRGMSAAGLRPRGGVFPLQTLAVPGAPAALVHRGLARRGVSALLHRGRDGEPDLGFVITAAHRPSVIESAVNATLAAAEEARRSIRAGPRGTTARALT